MWESDLLIKMVTQPLSIHREIEVADDDSHVGRVMDSFENQTASAYVVIKEDGRWHIYQMPHQGSTKKSRIECPCDVHLGLRMVGNEIPQRKAHGRGKRVVKCSSTWVPPGEIEVRDVAVSCAPFGKVNYTTILLVRRRGFIE